MKPTNITWILAAFILILSGFFIFYLSYPDGTASSLTGMAAAEIKPGQGCCERFCQVIAKEQCYEGEFHEGEGCNNIDPCNVGCCIDKEGYCLSNYIKANCEMYGYTFMKKECPELMQCVMPIPSALVRGDTGIELNIDPSIEDYYESASGISAEGNRAVFDEDDPYGIRYMIIDPLSGTKGTEFNIKYIISQFTDIEEVEITLRDNNTIITALKLFDDGTHEDGNSNDGVYGNRWDSSGLTGFTGLKGISVDAKITGKDKTTSLNQNIFGFTVASGSKCLPISPWNSENELDIVFLGNRYSDKGGVEKLKLDTKSNFDNLAFISPFRENFDNINFYLIEEELSFSPAGALSVIQSECDFFDETQDIAIIFDYDEKKCRKTTDSANIFTLSPETVYLFNAPFMLDEVTADLCDVAKTFEEYMEEMKNGIGVYVPQVELRVENEQTFWQNKAIIPYIINYGYGKKTTTEIYIDDDLMVKEEAEPNTLIEKEFELSDGAHKLFISAEGEFADGYSDTITFNIDGTINFGVNINSPGTGDAMPSSEVEVKFSITHSRAEKINYRLFIDSIEKEKGEAAAGVENILSLKNMKPGRHSVLIKAEDSEGRKAQSEEISFVATQ